MLDPNDNKEDLSAKEIYQKMINDKAVYLDGELCDLNDITESLIEDPEALLDAVQGSVVDDVLALHKLYIQTIQELIA